MLGEKFGHFCLNRLRQQGTRSIAQHLGERVSKRPWLKQLDHGSIGHGVSLLCWRSGGSNTPTIRRLLPVSPSPTSAHSSAGPGSECCVVVGDDNCEAYTAIRWGVGLSLEIYKVAEAEPVINVEGNMCGTVMRGAVAPPGSKATSRRKGTRRNLRDPTLDQRLKSRLPRVGKARSRSR